jgi:predicted O-linked N-acetylglucosamine transferase (SPINDLY family)
MLQVRVAGRPSSVSPYFCLYLPISAKLHQDVSESWAKGLRNQAGQIAIRDTAAAARSALPPLETGSSTMSPAQARALALAGGQAKAEGGQPRLRVGYISRRFEKYPGTQLLLRLFELHDRMKIEVGQK